MGNNIKAHVEFFLKELPPFMSFEQKNMGFEKGTQNFSSIHLENTNRRIYINICPLYEREEFYFGEKILYKKDETVEVLKLHGYNFKDVSEVNYFVELTAGYTKDMEDIKALLEIIDKLKPYLISGHNNVIGYCEDEDGHKDKNFVIYLDKKEFEKTRSIMNEICCDCNRFESGNICENEKFCKRAYDLGKAK